MIETFRQKGEIVLAVWQLRYDVVISSIEMGEISTLTYSVGDLVSEVRRHGIHWLHQYIQHNLCSGEPGELRINQNNVVSMDSINFKNKPMHYCTVRNPTCVYAPYFVTGAQLLKEIINTMSEEATDDT